MISFKDKYTLFKLKRRLQKLREGYKADIKKAQKDGKDRKDIEIIIGEMFGVCKDDEYEIEEIITKDLKRKAEKIFY